MRDLRFDLWKLTVAIAVTGICAARTSAAGVEPKYRSAVANGVAFLRKEASTVSDGQKSLAAYALFKAGEPINSPFVAGAISEAAERARKTDYTSHYQVYEAAIDMLLLADADGKNRRDEIEHLTAYLLGQQGPSGDWDYPDRNVGDSSISQFAILGLWAAARNGVDIPRSAWDKAAQWHLKTQMSDGGFSYHPGTSEGFEKGASSLSLTNGGAGSLLICRRFLFPNESDQSWRQEVRRQEVQRRPEPVKEKNKLDGILIKVDLDKVESNGKSEGSGPIQTSLSSMNKGIRRAVAWADSHFMLETLHPYKMYYYYSMERLGALSELAQLGGRDWFHDCADFLVARQQADGSWLGSRSGPVVGTSFVLLFLTRSTGQILGRGGPEMIGGGLMIGGRGLPDDPSQILVQGGEVKARKNLGPLDDLLATLERAENLQVRDTQQKIVEKVQLGNREELIGQVDRLIKLASHPQGEVRRTALWALGRSGDLKAVGVLLKGLQDPDVDVMVEAHNALCFLSRKPLAFGLPATPFTKLPEDVSEEQKQKAIQTWRQQAVAKWNAWAARIRPYQERDKLGTE